MGDRSQICMKDGKDEIFLYAHWAGTEIYKDLADALRLYGNARSEDFEYLSRIVFSRMIRSCINSENGYGIGVHRHDDIEHAIPVVWCDGSKRITWLPSNFGKKKLPDDCSFEEFVERADKGEYSEY